MWQLNMCQSDSLAVLKLKQVMAVLIHGEISSVIYLISDVTLSHLVSAVLLVNS